MYSYRLTPRATRQLERETTYSKQKWGAKHASKYRGELLAKVRKITKTPKLYAKIPEFGEDVRTIRYKGNYITYTVNEKEKTVIILGFPSIYKPKIDRS